MFSLTNGPKQIITGGTINTTGSTTSTAYMPFNELPKPTLIQQKSEKKKNSCNCKAEPEVDENGLEVKTPIVKYFFRTLLFIVAVVIGLPVIIPMIVYMLFKTIVLSKSVDFLSTLIKLGKLMKRVDEEDDTDELDDENYELMGVEDITSK